MNKKAQIISVSRRTDIPAYYADWFRSRLELGFTVYPNPITHKPVFLDLTPPAVKAFVFWTRDPKPLLKHLDYIDGKYNKMHYMHISINGLPGSIEERNPSIPFVLKTVEELNKRYGPEYVQWRFDPIVLSSITDEKWIRKTFTEIAGSLKGLTKRCYFSFVDLYKKTERNFNLVSQRHGISFFQVTIEKQVELIKELSETAHQNEIEMYACAEDQILDKLPCIKKAHCVDADIIEKLAVQGNSRVKYKCVSSRKGCGCYESKDIGYYNSCPHGCIYCYANMDPQSALKNAKEYLSSSFPYDKIGNLLTKKEDLFG